MSKKQKRDIVDRLHARELGRVEGHAQILEQHLASARQQLAAATAPPPAPPAAPPPPEPPLTYRRLAQMHREAGNPYLAAQAIINAPAVAGGLDAPVPPAKP